MIAKKIFCLTSLSFYLIFNPAIAQTEHNNFGVDVISYEVSLELDIDAKHIKGDVKINFALSPDVNKVVFNSGSLQITKVLGESIINYSQEDKKLILSLADRTTNENQIQVFYHTNPTKGLLFPEQGQAHTVYFTSEWMVCNDAPNDKAKFKIDLLIPSDKNCIASGTLIEKVVEEKKTLYSWSQDYETPTYTYGFAVGSFNNFEEKYQGVVLNYYSRNHTSSELQKIFGKTSDMMGFFEEKSGIPFVQNSYSQLLIGNHYQEMSGFAVLKNSYGKLVLKDSTETNLISHELAHQWWGNLITCNSWNHFWLNEGIATFMSAAYNEYRFGQEKYTTDIDSYFKVYTAIRNKGKDKPLVFDDWSNPTRDDRNLVYFKGAYVLHLLRIELGEQEFWNGIKLFSQKYFGKSVNTYEFQESMEESAGRNLNVFFNKWVYENEN